MLAAVLALLGLMGGAAGTFFIMDAPRRRTAELRRRLNHELDDVERARRDNEDRASRLADKSRDLRAVETSLDRRSAEFDRKVITYDDLSGENRLLKTDLWNMALVVAQAEAQTQMASGHLANLTQQRDSIGQAYLESIRAATLRALTASNYPASKRRLESAIAELETAGIRPTAAGRQQLFGELQRQYELAVRAEIERDEQARIREQMRVDQKRLREAQEAQEEAKQAERERQAIAETLALRRASGAQAAEMDQLRARLADAEAKVNAITVRAISLAQITRSGFVYVISNIGSFGPDVFKIGLTRREDPQERVDELGSASVPFPFDVHMTITSDDAPKLEAALHRAFGHRRVNRANPRKEFFRATIEEIVRAVREHHGEVQYRADPEAKEYLESRSMTDAVAAEIEKAHEWAEKATADVAVED
jgi:T5orf172 domain